MSFVQEHRGLFIFEGIVFVLLGILAIAIPGIFTLGVTLLVGWLFIAAGLVQLFRSVKAEGIPGALFAILSGIFYLVIGALLLLHPLTGVKTLTLLLAFFFLVDGIFQIAAGIRYRPFKNWGWLVLSGIISILLAAIIWSGWPGTAVWVIGLLVGINLLFAGISFLFLASES